MRDPQRPPSPPGGRDVGDLSWDEGERLSEEQQRLHPSIDRINRWAEQHPDVFAGVWLDNSGFLEGTGPVRVGVGYADADADDTRAMLEPLLDDPSLLVLVSKPLPLEVLREAQDRLVATEMREDRPRGTGVSGCGVDVDANAVSVMLYQPDEQLESKIREAHPDIPVIFEYGGLSFVAPDDEGVARRSGAS